MKDKYTLSPDVISITVVIITNALYIDLIPEHSILSCNPFPGLPHATGGLLCV